MAKGKKVNKGLRTIIIEWRGPFTLDEVTPEQGGNGIYSIWGKRKGQRLDRFYKIGITERLFCQRFADRDHESQEMRYPESRIWLGHIKYPANSKRKDLELAEHCLSTYIQPEKCGKKFHRPRRPVCIISQWYFHNGEPRLKHPTMPYQIPDVMWWDLVRWRTGVMKVHGEDE